MVINTVKSHSFVGSHVLYLLLFLKNANYIIVFEN